MAPLVADQLGDAIAAADLERAPGDAHRLGTGVAQLVLGPIRPVAGADDGRTAADHDARLGQVAGDGRGHDPVRAVAVDAQLGPVARPRAGRDHQRAGADAPHAVLAHRHELGTRPR